MLKVCLAMEGGIWGRDQPAQPSVFSRRPACRISLAGSGPSPLQGPGPALCCPPHPAPAVNGALEY